MIRLAHLSDVHISARPLGWTARDWFSKRLTGWMNLNCFGRARRFRETDEVFLRLMGELRQRQLDHVVFSGDATALGFPAEFEHAAKLFGINGPEPLPGLAVPGNHDYYTSVAERAGLFERYFASWQSGERIGTHVYPFAQRVGPIWLVGVNSCTANFWCWDASGRVGAAQLERLQQLLTRLGDGPRILVTHYPVALADRRPESGHHGLRDLDALIAVAARGGVGLWLHGHRHGAYRHLDNGLAPFPVVCAGSATETGRWSYGEYQIDGRDLQAVRRVYDPSARAFRDAEAFALTLSSP